MHDVLLTESNHLALPLTCPSDDVRLLTATSHCNVRCLGALCLKMTVLAQHNKASKWFCRSEDDPEYNPVQNAVVAVFNRIVDSSNPGLEPAQVFVGRMLLVPPQVPLMQSMGLQQTMLQVS